MYPYRTARRSTVVFVLWLVVSLLTVGGASAVSAQTVSHAFRIPSSASISRRSLQRKLTLLLRARGHRVVSGITRKGYHFIHRFRQTLINRRRQVPTCNVVIRFRVIYMPGRRYVYKGRARGTTNFTRYIRLSRKQRKELCQNATQLALRRLAASARKIINAVEQQRKNLPANRILGQAYRGSLRGGLSGGTKLGGVQDGKPLRGRKPRLKWAPPGLVRPSRP